MKNAAYWSQRALDNLIQSEASVVDYENQLQLIYETALKEIKKDIDAFYGRYAKENKISLIEARKQLSSTEFKTFRQDLAEWQQLAREKNLSADYSAYLKSLSRRMTLNRLEYLQAQIRVELEKLHKSRQDTFLDLATQNFIASYYTTYYNVSLGMETSVKFGALDKKGVDAAVRENWSGEQFSDRIWKDKIKLINTMKTVLPQSFTRGLHSNQLGDMIAKDLGTSKKNGRALARTEINHLANRAALGVLKEAGINTYLYIATLDLRTTPVCRDLDGYVGEVSKAEVGVNYPPMHVNCRSTASAHIKDSKRVERIARDSDGKSIFVRGDMTQEEWIKEFAPKDQQEKLLKFVGKYRPKN